MDDDAVRFGTLTQRVKGWLRVSRFLSASMVVYLRFNCHFQVDQPVGRGSANLVGGRREEMAEHLWLRNYSARLKFRVIK